MSVRIGMVGCGGFAKVHAEGYKRLADVEVVALVEPDAERADKFRQEHFPEARLFDSLDALLADGEANLNGVSIVTPHTTHHPLCKQALEAGLHVLVEKPMTTSSEDAYDLWRTSVRAGKQLMVGYQSVYSPAFRHLVHERDHGEFGKIEVINAVLAQGWRGGTSGKWRQEPGKSGGGFLYDSGAHALNAVMYLASAPVVEVAAYIDNVDAPVDINGVVAMKFQNGVLASAALAGNNPGWHNSITVCADRRRALTDAHGSFLEIKDKHDKLDLHIPRPDETEGGFGTPQHNFVEVIRGDAEPIGPARLGVLLSALMDAIYESAEKKTPVSVTPVPETV